MCCRFCSKIVTFLDRTAHKKKGCTACLSCFGLCNFDNLLVEILRCRTTAWPMDVAKLQKMVWHCLNSPRTLRSFVNGRSRSSAPASSGLLRPTLTCAASILARSILSLGYHQGPWSWDQELLPLCSSVHPVPHARVWVVVTVCLLSSRGAL